MTLGGTAMFAILLVSRVSTALAANSPWTVETVDAGGGGKFVSVAADRAGNLHGAYSDDATRQLKYLFWDRRRNQWFTMPVGAANCRGFVSLALDSQQHPHISYLDVPSGLVNYARWDGSAWVITPLKLSARLVEYYTSIALDSNDRPIITFYEILKPGSADYVLTLRCARWSGQAWEVTTIDSTPGSGKFNALIRGTGDDLQIAYANVKYENASLRYARWNGQTWKIELLEGALGSAPSYSVFGTLDSKGIPHITYTDGLLHLVKYAVRGDGQKWRIETVDQLSREAFPDRNGLALDEEDQPFIGYYDSAQGILKAAYKQGGRWTVEIIDSGFVGYTSAVQIVGHTVFVLYYDSLSNSLKSARRTLPASRTAAGSNSKSGLDQ